MTANLSPPQTQDLPTTHSQATSPHKHRRAAWPCLLAALCRAETLACPCWVELLPENEQKRVVAAHRQGRHPHSTAGSAGVLGSLFFHSQLPKWSHSLTTTGTHRGVLWAWYVSHIKPPGGIPRAGCSPPNPETMEIGIIILFVPSCACRETKI